MHRWYWTAWLCGRIQYLWYRRKPPMTGETPLACPFCGLTPTMNVTDTGCSIRCTYRKCGAQPMVMANDTERALLAWNRRANPLPWW